MTAVNISGTFKKDERPNNGLEAIAAQLLKDDLAQHVVVGVVQFHASKKAGPGEPYTPTVHFNAIEPLTGDAADEARLLLNAARTVRGMDAMPATLFDADAAPADPEWDPDRDPDLLQYAEEQAEQREAEQGPVEHEGATEGYADELAEMKADLGVVPTTCVVCSRDIHYDPAHESYVDADGWARGREDGGHEHQPAERAHVASDAR